MQNQRLLLSAAQPAISMAGFGNGFWYESATVTGDSRIVLVSDRGDEIVLRPGQACRMTHNVTNWHVRSYSGTADIDANIITGSGEFSDNNTTIASGTFAVSNFPETQPVSGTVAVSNLPATQQISGTVGVSNFPATQAVSGNITAMPRAYTNAWSKAAVTNIGTAIELVSPAANVNGIILHWAIAYNAGNQFIAHTAAPTALGQGDILYYRANANSSESFNPIRIPPGKGLYYYAWAQGDTATNLCAALWTLL